MTYTSKKQAVRAAKDQGLDPKSVYQHDGKWILGIPMTANENVEQNVEQPSPWSEQDIAAAVEEGAEAEAETIVASVEEPTIYWPTEASTPFKIIWGFLDLNPWMTRKAQIATLTAYGLNENTIRTQVSRYNKWDGDKQALLANEKRKRDDERAHIAALVKEIQAKNASEAADAAAADAAGDEVSE